MGEGKSSVAYTEVHGKKIRRQLYGEAKFLGRRREWRGGLYAEKGRAGAGEDACPRGSRGWAIAQEPTRPGEGLGCRSRDDRPEARGLALPAVNELVDLDEHLLSDRRHAIARRVEAGDVDGTRHRGRARAEDPEVATGLTTLAERGSAADDGVVAGIGGAGELERDDASSVGDDESLRGEVGEERVLRRRDHLSLAELDQGAVDFGEELEAAQNAILAQARAAFDLLGSGHPGDALGFRESPPTGSDTAEV